MDTARLSDFPSIPSKAGLREKCPAPAAEAGLKKTENPFFLRNESSIRVYPVRLCRTLLFGLPNPVYPAMPDRVSGPLGPAPEWEPFS